MVIVSLVTGGLGLSLLDECIVTEEISYGCTGIGTAIAANGLAVSVHAGLSIAFLLPLFRLLLFYWVDLMS